MLRLVFSFALSFWLVGCGTQPQTPQTISEPKTSENTGAEAELGNGFTAHNLEAAPELTSKLPVSYLRSLASTKAAPERSVAAPISTDPDSLILGYPVELLGQWQSFGGVITGVSDGESESLGRLKLTSLPPIHIRSAVVEDASGDFFLQLNGCPSQCKPDSTLRPLLQIPIKGAQPESKRLLLDFSSLGRDLNIMDSIDPNGNGTQLKTLNSKVTLLDYSQSTLVFDVLVTMIPKNSFSFFGIGPKRTYINVRWYLKPLFDFTAGFQARGATEGVGFFMTQRSAEPKVLHFPVSPNIKIPYYVKNVPAAHQEAFKLAFDNWNNVLGEEIGVEPLEYVFVNGGTPLGDRLVTGDARYRIVEWDVDNLAPYGGLGPANGNQVTGEIFSANVLVQGPKIVEIYTEWFQAAQKADAWASRGWVTDQESAQMRSAVLNKLPAAPTEMWSVTLGDLSLTVPAQLPEFQDPILRREDFDLIPPGMDYKTYMKGYFQELVGHELGHNLGLRHNFRGNLASKVSPDEGKVSSSIMEYLGRGHRHLNRIGEYDRMAIRYGYDGALPQRRDMFCTDEDVATPTRPQNSPECSRDDATADPFRFFGDRIRRVLSLVTNEGKSTAGDWELADVQTPLQTSVSGIGLYAITETSTQWTNFNLDGTRPEDPAEISAYVLKSFKEVVCDAQWDDEVAAKATQVDQEKTAAKLKQVRDYASRSLRSTTGFSLAQASCP